MTTLVCPECGRENESERLYCHSCGARLDRSTLATQERVQEEPQEIQQRLQKMFDPRRGKFRQTFLTGCKLILGACLTASIVEMISPPEVSPAAKNVVLPAQINFDLENAALYHRPARLEYSQEQVNAYLAYTLKSKHKVLDKPLLGFNRAAVAFSEDVCNITVERSLLGYSIYSRASYRVAVNEGKIAASNKGGWIGRLPIDPYLMQFGNIIFTDIWSALDRERKLVTKMGGIEFHDGKVVLIAPPT